MIKEYLLENWALILVLSAFAIALNITVFLSKKAVRRTYILIIVIFLLSIVVFEEFYLAEEGAFREIRIVLMAIRYSATPFIIAQVAFTLIKKQHWLIFIPALVLAVIDFISIFTGIVFSIGEDNVFHRGPLGYLPFIMVGLYCVFLVVLLIKRSNKTAMEIIPIAFLAAAFAAGLVFPFVFGSDYSHIFCTTIAIALFVYFAFSILQQTKKDSLTGLLGRQAYYADISSDPDSITALVSIDMNGLKAVNDTSGHAAGDEALTLLAICFMNALRRKQSGYRIGGDEFVIVCRKNSRDDVVQLIKRIQRNVGETPYTCSVGYGFNEDGKKTVDELIDESDDMMYAEKERYYTESGRDRRRR